MQKNTEVQNLIDRIDKSGPNFDDLDPSLSGDYTIAYFQEINVNMNVPTGFDSNERKSIQDNLRVKILKHKIPPGRNDEQIKDSYDNIKIELTNENDLFFHFTWQANPEEFRQFQQKNKLNIHYDQFVGSLIKLFNRCINEPLQFQLIFSLLNTHTANLRLIQITEYKTLELFKLDFTRSNDEIMRQSVMFRFNCIMGRQQTVKNQMGDLFNILEKSNTALLQYVKKNTGLTHAKPVY